jgi:hypothetical protein
MLWKWQYIFITQPSSCFVYHLPNLLLTQNFVYPTTLFSSVPPPAINNDRSLNICKHAININISCRTKASFCNILIFIVFTLYYNSIYKTSERQYWPTIVNYSKSFQYNTLTLFYLTFFLTQLVVSISGDQYVEWGQQHNPLISKLALDWASAINEDNGYRIGVTSADLACQKRSLKFLAIGRNKKYCEAISFKLHRRYWLDNITNLNT